MTTLYYTAAGGAKTGGCALTSRYVYIPYKWGENSVLYIKHKAVKGILERIAVKRVILNSGPKTGNQIVPIYQDTLNSLWNESDLITESEARDLALAYWEAREAQIAAAQCK
jgi:hypothetical protein